jgi:polyhydroxybutyrate depolymerase
MVRGHMRAARWLVAIALVPTLGCGGARSGAQRTTTTSPAATVTTAMSTGSTASTGAAACGAPHAAGQTTESFDFEGTTRTYELYVPPGYDGTTPVPVVFDFHGYGSSAKEQMLYGNFRPEADRDTFLIVAPDGQGASRHFNLTGEPGLQDDVAMVGALLDHVEAGFCVDTHRVFSTGMSDGGAMTSVLACISAARFAAFAPVAVIVHPPCPASRSVPIEAFMGTDDPIVPFNGGTVNCCGNATIGAAPDAMAGWADQDGCAATPTEDQVGSEVRRQTWTGCTGGADVVFYIIDGGGHTWPGAIPIAALGKTTDQVDASQTIWDFFKAPPLP